MFRYLNSSKELVLTLDAGNLNVMKWYVDASFAVHKDMRSHTGAMLTLGKGCVYSTSGKHKLNGKSSTEAELVAVSDVLPQVLWTKNFVEAQGCDLGTPTVYQDNQSAIKLETNGIASSGKRTRHINIRYFFVAEKVASNEVAISYCHTDDICWQISLQSLPTIASSSSSGTPFLTSKAPLIM